MKEFCFYLESYTYIWEKQDIILLYNSLSSETIIIDKSSDIEDIISGWLNPDNLYSVQISDNALKNERIIDLIKKVRESFSGDIVDTSVINSQLVSLKPFLNFQKGFARLKNETDKFAGDNIMGNLHEISVYINGSCMQNCANCSQLFKQVHFCTKNKNNLSIEQIESFLTQCCMHGISRVNIMGGDIFAYSSLLKLSKKLNQYNTSQTYFSHYLNIFQNIETVKLLNNESVSFNILINFPVIMEKLYQVCLVMKDLSIKTNWSIAITSETEYEEAENIIETHNLDNVEIKPFYNGKNLTFFENAVYITKEDVQNFNLNRRHIFSHQVINSNNFGKLTLMTDGRVYANLNHAPLGEINNDVRELIYREIDGGLSWNNIRDMKPCSDCVYQWLCPSPSNYEYIIGKPNLCHILT